MSHFPNVPVIEFEGSKSKNPFAFKHYNPDEKIGGKKMKDHMRFAAAYWHVMRNSLSDPFGAGTALMPWDDGSDSLDNALRRIPVGTTTSYGALAAAIGRPAAVRAVGLANGANPIGIVVPCHRVVGSTGKLTGYAGGVMRKAWLIAHEWPAQAAEQLARSLQTKPSE